MISKYFMTAHILGTETGTDWNLDTDNWDCVTKTDDWGKYVLMAGQILGTGTIADD